MNTNIRISAFIMAVTIFLMSFSPVLSVDAKGGRDLYGTGSADDINIIKLLDMALNRGGMSMSPATIQQFLEYWWDSVNADLTTCINNVDTSISGTSAFVNALNAALESSEHYDKLGDIIKKYINFCTTMEYKSLSDFKQLLTQEGTFRKFLLSYVTDENGNLVGTVDNKLAKYNLKSGFVNMVRQAADAYIEEYEGYYLVKTFTIDDIRPADFKYKEDYDIAYYFLKNKLGDELVAFKCGGASSMCFLHVLLFDGINLVDSPYSDHVTNFQVFTYDDNWKQAFPYFWSVNPAATSYDIIDSFPDTSGCQLETTSSKRYSFCVDKTRITTNANFVLFSKDGRAVKIWKTLDAFKNYTAGKSDIYYSTQYSGFDYTVDNSIEFNYDYYTNNEYSHTVIQNNIDNSTEVNETTINNIVNNYITNNNYGDGSGSGGGGSSGGGNWFTDLISGIPELLASLINGLAGILDSVGNLVGKLVDLCTVLFVPSADVFDSVTTKVNDKFTFKDQSETNIRLIFDELPNMGQTAPTITFPFSETTLSKYGLEDVTVSFDWYEPYKPTVDAIFSAILWAMFAFNQYFAVKNIINASGSAVDISTRI